MVNGLRTVSRLDYLGDHLRRLRNFAGFGNGEKDLLDLVVSRKVPRHAVGNQDRVVGNFRLSKSFHSLAESPNDGEWQAADFDLAVFSGILSAKHPLRKLLADHCNLPPRHRIFVVKKPTGEN